MTVEVGQAALAAEPPRDRQRRRPRCDRVHMTRPRSPPRSTRRPPAARSSPSSRPTSTATAAAPTSGRSWRRAGPRIRRRSSSSLQRLRAPARERRAGRDDAGRGRRARAGDRRGARGACATTRRRSSGSSRRMLAAAQAGLVISEDHNFCIDNMSIHHLRAVLLEAGRRLVDDGAIVAVDDVLMLYARRAAQRRSRQPGADLRAGRRRARGRDGAPAARDRAAAGARRDPDRRRRRTIRSPAWR